MQVTAWNNGGSGYGLEILASDRDRFFDRNWREVVLDLSGQGQATITISPSFWRRCSELRSADIGRWLQQNGPAPWPRGRRPKVVMQYVADNRFAVKLSGR
jgi:hypothetical protein